MTSIVLRLNLVGLFILLASAGSVQGADASRTNVILITLDGVIAKDFYNPKLLKEFWKRNSEKSLKWGGSKDSLGTAEVLNKAYISMPGYFSIFAGKETDCQTNDCERIQTETFPEKIVRELGLAKTDAVAVTSWERLPRAIESREGTVLVNSGFQNAPSETLLACSEISSELDLLASAQSLDRPTWEQNRFDKYTWAFANLMFDCHKPRLLYVSLNDTDDYAHLGERENYEAALKGYDQWLVDFQKRLEKLELYKNNTLVILASDHGRGEGDQWQRHNSNLETAKNTYLTLIGIGTGIDLAALKKKYAGPVNHSHIRQIIEDVMLPVHASEPVKEKTGESSTLEIVVEQKPDVPTENAN